MNHLVLAQFGGDQWWSGILWIVFMMVFFMFYPRMMLAQIMWKLEKTAADLEAMSEKAKKFVIKNIEKKPKKPVVDSVNRFFEFFVISPVSLDPYGIVRKFEHLIQNQQERFKYFVNQIAPKMDKEKKANIEMGLAGGMSLYEVAKIVRHYVELAKKTKNIQIAMILQMQMPLIERIAKSLYTGTHSLTRGEPIGDGLGPLAAAKLMGNRELEEIEEDIVMAKIRLYGVDAFILKAKGPGGRLGRPGKAVDKLMKTNKIAKIITIDAAAKLEGEKTGSIAEGVGVAMGGVGVERVYIENVAVQNNIPLDSIVVKMSQEEAITPMRKAIKDAYPQVRESIERSLKNVKKGSKVVIVGVGNTSGIGNSEKEIGKAEKWIDQHEKKLKQKKKKKSSFF